MTCDLCFVPAGSKPGNMHKKMVSVKHRLQTQGKMQTEGKVQT